jgi:membrane protein DedA with SNARE-associated domain
MAHIQLIIGLVLYFTSPKVVFEASSMSSPLLRFFLVEHISLMIIAIILITVGYAKSKRITDIRKKNRTIVIYYAISLVLILAAIPWPFRNLGAGWV